MNEVGRIVLEKNGLKNVASVSFTTALRWTTKKYDKELEYHETVLDKQSTHLRDSKNANQKKIDIFCLE